MNTNTAAALAATNVTFVNPYCASWTEVHAEGCKAITRRVKGVDPEVVGTFAASTVLSMQANPDEGYLKIHTCLKATGLKSL